jgi:hypothetical protein
MNTRIDALDIPSRVQRKRALVSLAKEMEELARDGLFLRGMVRV